MTKDNKSTLVIVYIVIALAALYFFGANIYGQDTDVLETPGCNTVWNPDSNYNFATFCSADEAIAEAEEIGCEGYHTHKQDGEIIFMSCEKHGDLDQFIEVEDTGGSY